MFETDIHVMVRLAANDAGGIRALARRWDLSAAYISDVIRGKRAPGQSILDHLGVIRVVRYEKGPKDLPPGVGGVGGTSPDPSFRQSSHRLPGRATVRLADAQEGP